MRYQRYRTRLPSMRSVIGDVRDRGGERVRVSFRRSSNMEDTHTRRVASTWTAPRALLFGLAVAVLAAAFARPALAARPAWPARMHATLLSSEPAKGSTVATSPVRIYLVFSEEVEPSLSRIRLVGPDGRVVALESTGDPRNVSALMARVTTPLANGTWRVEWRIVSEDGHPIDGDFTFAVGAPSTAGAAVAAPPSGDEAHDTTMSASPAAGAASVADSTTTASSAMSKVPVLPALLRGLGVGVL